MKLSTKVLAFVAACVLIPLAGWAAMAKIRHEIEHQFELKARQDSLERAEKGARGTLDSANVQYVDRWHERVKYVDRVLPADRTKPVPVDTVRQLANKCTEEANACEKRQKAAADLISNLEGQVSTLKAQKGSLKPPRIGVTADGMWDVFEKTPGARLNTNVRIAGPISLFAEGQAVVRSKDEISTTPRDSSRVRSTLFVGTRITFR